MYSSSGFGSGGNGGIGSGGNGIGGVHGGNGACLSSSSYPSLRTGCSLTTFLKTHKKSFGWSIHNFDLCNKLALAKQLPDPTGRSILSEWCCCRIPNPTKHSISRSSNTKSSSTSPSSSCSSVSDHLLCRWQFRVSFDGNSVGLAMRVREGGEKEETISDAASEGADVVQRCNLWLLGVDREKKCSAVGMQNKFL
eukprot:GHVS01099279.1.p2 GENE.GHVS01099279.1~~GHVS01099279.1.p2  ORF type:complete len:195 (-),score=56.60 GHVS01099279.1:950-1534(-)